MWTSAENEENGKGRGVTDLVTFVKLSHEGGSNLVWADL